MIFNWIACNLFTSEVHQNYCVYHLENLCCHAAILSYKTFSQHMQVIELNCVSKITKEKRAHNHATAESFNHCLPHMNFKAVVKFVTDESE